MTQCFRFTAMLGLLAMLLLTAPSPAPAEPPGTISRPLVTGTFIQLHEKHGGWSQARWEKLFDQFHSLGVRQVVVQWAVSGDLAFYPTQSFRQASCPPLETILQLAEARGIEVCIGLANDPLYWEKIQQAPPALEEYLGRLRLRSEQVAREVAALSIKYRAFKGWYISEEIDDSSWGPARKRALFYEHLGQLSRFLKKISPNSTIMVSAFSGNRMSPDAYGDFLQKLLAESMVDILLFQDSIGTGKLSLEHLPLYLKAVRHATDAHDKKLQVVVELFQIVSETPFGARSAEMSRIVQQLKLAAGFANAGIGSFSIPDYMFAENGAELSPLLQEYRRYAVP